MQWVHSAHRHALAVVALLLLLTACAPVRAIPQPPVFHQMQQRPLEAFPLAATEQSLRLALRQHGGVWQARLEAPLLCNVSLVESQTGFRVIRRELSRTDEILKWSGYAGAGLTAGLVGIGMARGRDVGRGLSILALYGIPLGGLGAYEWWRSRPVTEPVAGDPQLVRRIQPCGRGRDEIDLQLAWEPSDVAPATVTEPARFAFTVGSQWRAVELSALPKSAASRPVVLPVSAGTSAWFATLPHTFGAGDALAEPEAPAPVTGASFSTAVTGAETYPAAVSGGLEAAAAASTEPTAASALPAGGE